jgi:glycosyltransferase involved in cell wall biosynthesis
VTILYVGPLTPGDTCALRRETLERMGHVTVPVDVLDVVRRRGPLARRIEWRLRTGALVRDLNRAIVDALAAEPDVLWVDKGLFVTAATLEAARRAGVGALVHYSPDNHCLAQNASRHLRRALPLYDVVVTTKRTNVAPLERAGARRVLLSGNAYDTRLHRPVELSATEHEALACDVVFVGRREPARERLLAGLATLPIRLRVAGPGWEGTRSLAGAVVSGPLYGDAYPNAIAAAKIALGLLSTVASDAITQRSIEIPACGGFLLAERTAEHQAHFVDGAEAVFFDGPDDLAEKIERYLADDGARARIAAAGRERCIRSGYAYEARLAEILDAAGVGPGRCAA